MKRQAPVQDATFEDSVTPEVAARYRRLQTNQASAGVLVQLKRRGFTEQTTEFLLRNLARIPDEWEKDNEPWPQIFKRRARLSKKLRELADDIANDPDIGQLSFEIRKTHLNGEPEPGMVTLEQLLRNEAQHLEPENRTPVRKADGRSMTASEWEKSIRPQRKVAKRAHTLLAVFDLLQPFTKHKPNRPPRAPNREAEILAGVVLGETIPPGTLTQLRKGDRRRYHRDKQ